MNYDGNQDNRYQEKEEIFSRPVKAGKRTYFFDVRATKANDYYVTITESKKRFGDDGKFRYEKHKLFLYKEDFDKFVEGLIETINFIRTNNPQNPNFGNIDPNHNPGYTYPATEQQPQQQDFNNNGNHNPVSSDVNFEDLGNH